MTKTVGQFQHKINDIRVEQRQHSEQESALLRVAEEETSAEAATEVEEDLAEDLEDQVTDQAIVMMKERHLQAVRELRRQI